jgi:hypothetical protein
MSKEENKGCGCGSTLTILGIVFIVLKLTGNIDWSWFWVLSPFFASIAITLFVLAFAFFGLSLTALILYITEKFK